MNKQDIDVKKLLIHVFLGWLVVSQLTLFHIQIADMQAANAEFTLGLIGGVTGCMLGFMAYRNKWFMKDD